MCDCPLVPACTAPPIGDGLCETCMHADHKAVTVGASTAHVLMARPPFYDKRTPPQGETPSRSRRARW